MSSFGQARMQFIKPCGQNIKSRLIKGATTLSRVFTSMEFVQRSSPSLHSDTPTQARPGKSLTGRSIMVQNWLPSAFMWLSNISRHREYAAIGPTYSAADVSPALVLSVAALQTATWSVAFPILGTTSRHSVPNVIAIYTRQRRIRRSAKPIDALTMTPRTERITTPTNNRSRS